MSPARRFRLMLWRDPFGRSALLVLGVIGLVAWGSLLVWPSASPIEASLPAGTGAHLLGTDARGGDLLLELLHSLGGALWVCLAGAVCAAFIGLLLGLFQAVAGWRAEGFVGLLATAVRGLSAPFLPLLLFVLMEPSEWLLILSFALLAWPMLAAHVRRLAEDLWSGHASFASRALGRSALGVCMRHLVYPAVMGLAAQLPRLLAMALLGFVALDAVGLLADLRLSGLGQLLFPEVDLGIGGPRVSVETASRIGWAAWLSLLLVALGLAMMELSLARIRGRNGQRASAPHHEGFQVALAPGRVVTLMGPECCGKSSLGLAAIGLADVHWDGFDQAQLVQQLSNQLTWSGEDLLSASAERHAQLRGGVVRLLVQNAHLSLPQSPTVATLLAQLGLRTAEGEALCEDLGLALTQGELAGSPIALSRAQRQLIALAAVVNGAKGLLILDEPLAVLNPMERRRAEAVITEAVQKGAGLLVLTSDPELPRQLGGYVVLLGQQRMEEEGAVETFEHRTDTALGRLLRPEVDPLVQAAGQRNVFLDVRLLSIPARSVRWAWARRLGRAVHGANFVASRAETLAILGGEGSGRQELAWGLLALDRRGMSGQIRFESQDLLKLTAGQLRLERPRIQLVLADPSAAFARHLTLLDGLSEGLSVIFPQLSAAERLSRCREILRLVDLDDDCLSDYPSDLSALDLQKLALARAALVEPLVVILIDPTRDLGPQSQLAFLEAMVRIQRAMGIAMILSTNDFRLTRQVAHRVLVMRQGSIVEFGPVDHVFGQPRQEATQLMLDAAFPDQRLSSH